MAIIDLLITKGVSEIKLSDLELQVQDVLDRSPQLVADSRSVRGRSGFIFNGITYSSKTIDVFGKYLAGNSSEFEKKKDELNGLLLDSRPFYITKMLPETDDLYGYEDPGGYSQDLNLIDIPHEPYDYRWEVISNGAIEWEFRGKSAHGLLFDFSMSFVTAELPFGETVPQTITVMDLITYKGTAVNSQLESPWTIRLTATEQQSGSFDVRIGERTFTYETQTPIQAGDVFELKGIETLLNKANVNHKTNYEHFELDPRNGRNIPVDTSFVGTIEIVNFKEFYL